MSELVTEMQVVVKLTEECISENSRKAQNQQMFNSQYNGLLERYETAKNKYDELVLARDRKHRQGQQIDRFIEQLKDRTELLTEFDDKLWLTTVDKAVVRNDGVIEFHFYGGQVVEG